MERKKVAPDIDSYIAGFTPEVQTLLQSIRDTIHQAAPEAEEAIAYGIPTFKYHGNLVHFAGYKHHIGFYPAPQGLEAFKEELSKYKGSKGAVQFPIDKPMPMALIKKMVKFRMAQNLEAAKLKKLKIR